MAPSVKETWQKRIKTKFKESLMLFHSILRHNAGTSVCNFCFCYESAVLVAVKTHKSGAAATTPSLKKIRLPNAKLLDIDDFSANRIEEHC